MNSSAVVNTSQSVDRPLSLKSLRALAKDRKLAALTCYDASFAALMDQVNVDILLVGDSLGMVVQGHTSTLPVSIQDIAYHVSAVARGNRRGLIMADMPFGSYQQSPAHAYANAVLLLQAGAHMVKLEGGKEMADTVNFITQRGIPVCGHIGLLPQHVNSLGGYKVQGKTPELAQQIIEDALALERAGAEMIVIEAVPEPLAARIAHTVKMLTIGIGASVQCDGQVLVLQDVLGISQGMRPRFVKNFMLGANSVSDALSRYVHAVTHSQFPEITHTYT